MVAEFDEDKRISLEKYSTSLLNINYFLASKIYNIWYLKAYESSKMRVDVTAIVLCPFLRCREACLQLHEDAKNLLRDQLNQEHEQTVQELKYVWKNSTAVTLILVSHF